MKRSIIVATVTALLVAALPLVASAARVDAAAFAADCNDDSLVTVSGTLQVRGGSGMIATDCVVVIDDGSRLFFRDANLSCGVGCSLVVGASGEGSTVKVVRSTINVTGPLLISAGCCSGGENPESRGSVKVVDSALTGSSVEVSASVATDGGRVVVRRSKLSATGPFGLSISTFTDGRTTVVGNTLNSAGDIDVRSGFGTPGNTKARNNEFNASGTVTITATGGSCVSTGNTPAVPCT